MNSRSKLTNNFKFRFIKKELTKLYGKDVTGRMIASAERYFIESVQLCQHAAEGEWPHLEGTILPTVSIYKALREIDPEHALTSAHTVMMNVCEVGGAFLRGMLKIPGTKGIFMWFLPRMAVNMFGENCGFRYENYEANSRKLKMDMTACPYCRYATFLGTPELMPVFCDSDFATYGNLPGIHFNRTQTLGTGGSCCDFLFTRE